MTMDYLHNAAKLELKRMNRDSERIPRSLLRG
jgi:hypothetical protein